MYIIAYILLVFQVGLRWETGTDWDSYLNHFELINDIASTSPLENGFELGYNLSIWLVKLMFSEYTFFLLFHALVFYIILFYSLSRYTPYFFVSLLLFYTWTMGVMGSNRQLIAIVICLYSLRYVLDKNPIKFFFLVFIAFSFHVTALLFIMYYFINRDIKPYILILILAGSIIIGKSQLPLILIPYIGDLMEGNNSAAKVLFYLETNEKVALESKLSIFGLLKRLIFLSIFYYNLKKIRGKLPYYNMMLNGYIIAIAFYFLFADSLLIMLSRGSLYFNAMELLLLSSQICLYKRKENRVLISFVLLLLSFLLFFQSISPYPELFLPYKGIFINSDYFRIM